MIVQPDQITHLRDLRPDEFNPRKHNPRNIGQVGESLQQFGPMRSIVIDEHGTVLSGNGVVEAAAQVGIERVRVFDRATGELGPEPPGEGPYLLAVRVTGLTDKQKQQYKVADNRSAELADWDADVLKAMIDRGEAPDDWFFEDELKRAMFTAGMGDGMTVDHTAVITDEDSPIDEKYTADYKADRYNETTVRQVQLIMTVDEYHDLVPKMQRIMQEEGLDSNYDVVRHVVDAYLRDA